SRVIAVLIPLHKNAADLVAQRCRDLAPGQQYSAPVHKFGIVEHPFGVQDIKVFVEEGPTASPPPSTPRRGKGPTERLGPIGTTRFQAPSKCLSDPELLLRSGQQAQRRAEP